MDEADALVSEARRFRTNLSRMIGPVERVIVFGSRATGTGRADSDVDLLVVSPAFAGLDAIDRAATARDAWLSDLAVDLLCYTPEEFERLRTQATIVRTAVREGREVTA